PWVLGGRQALLILDNFERLLPAAADIAALLAACPRVKVLSTSRAPLRISGEREVTIPPLQLPAFGESAASDAGESDAVRLFMERAAAVRADFAPSPDDVAAVAAICRRLDGLPLAIELAVAHVRVLSPRALLIRLERRLPLLTGGPGDQPARLRT